MAGSHAFMRKEGGKIEKVALHKWARYRRSGYVFADEAAYNEQQAGVVVEKATTVKKKKKVSKKKG